MYCINFSNNSDHGQASAEVRVLNKMLTFEREWVTNSLSGESQDHRSRVRVRVML